MNLACPELYREMGSALAICVHVKSPSQPMLFESFFKANSAIKEHAKCVVTWA